MTSLVPDPGFDFGSWTSVTGLSVTGSKIELDGSNGSFANISQTDYFTPIPDDTATYELSIEVTRFVASGRIRLIGICLLSDSFSDTNGNTIPERIGASTITPSGLGVLGPYTFTVQPGTIYFRLQFAAIDANLDMSLDNLSIINTSATTVPTLGTITTTAVTSDSISFSLPVTS